MTLPARLTSSDAAVRRQAAQDWVAARLAWERRTLGRSAGWLRRYKYDAPLSSWGSPTKAIVPLASR